MSGKKTSQTVATSVVRLLIPVGKSLSSAPIGPALGQRGINIGEFTKQFNQKTKEIKPDTPIPVHVTVKSDRTFTFVTKMPHVSYFLKKACDLEKGAHQPGRHIVGQLTLRHVYEIAQVKQQDPSLQHLPLQKICACIIGSARSMGIQIVNEF
jgi:large subunit ribosomal protein L11